MSQIEKVDIIREQVKKIEIEQKKKEMLAIAKKTELID